MESTESSGFLFEVGMLGGQSMAVWGHKCQAEKGWRLAALHPLPRDTEFHPHWATLQ